MFDPDNIRVVTNEHGTTLYFDHLLQAKECCKDVQKPKIIKLRN